MRKVLGLCLLTVFALLLASPALAAPTWDKDPKAFVHGIALEIDGKYYYFAGPGSVPDATDVPGHTWVLTGPYGVVGRHYNIGPYNTTIGSYVPSWWATEEPDGVLLFMVHGIVDIPPGNLTEEKEEWLKDQGYVHFHELVDEDGNQAEHTVVYLKHIAVREFWFNGPMAMMMNNTHYVTQGIDYNFMPNW